MFTHATRRYATRKFLLAATILAVLPIIVEAKDIKGTAGANTLRGTAYADKMYGLSGHDRMYGLGGDDLIQGGPGSDYIEGGAGGDVLAGGIYAVCGDDNGHDTIKGLGGNDYLHGQIGDDKLYGGDGNNSLEGGPGNDLLTMGAGTDVWHTADYYVQHGRDEYQDPPSCARDEAQFWGLGRDIALDFVHGTDKFTVVKDWSGVDHYFWPELDTNEDGVLSPKNSRVTFEMIRVGDRTKLSTVIDLGWRRSIDEYFFGKLIFWGVTNLSEIDYAGD